MSKRSTERFSDRADDYARHRPSYPDAAIDAALAGLGDPAALVAADVGAGTGISARLLADRGMGVHALEPNEAMRSAAQPHKGIVWSAAAAEKTGLPNGSVDLVLCAQSFHWFANDAAVAEFHRVLRRGGRLALLWNKKDLRDAFTAAWRDAIFDLAGDAPGETFEVDAALLTRGGFGPLQHTVVDHGQRLDAEGVIGRAVSSSHVPKSGKVHDEIVARLKAVHARFAAKDGSVEMRLQAHLSWAPREALGA